MSWNPPDPISAIAASDAAAQLGLARAQGARLADTGLFGVIRKTPSGALLADQSAVEQLAARQKRHRHDLPPALVLRAGPPVWDESDGRWVGFHTDMSDSDVVSSALRWWPVRDASRLAVQHALIVVSVATFPAWVGRLTGEPEFRAGRVAFSAKRETSSESNIYLEARLDLPRGPLIDRVNLD